MQDTPQLENMRLEMQLNGLNRQIQNATNRAEKLQDDAAGVIAELKSRGVSLTSPDAVHVVGNVQGNLDEVAAEIAQANAQRKIVMEQLSELVLGGGYDGSTAGGMRLEFGPDDMRNAFEAIRNRQPVHLGGGGSGPMAAVDSSSFPQGAVAEYRITDVFPYLREAPIIANLFPVEATERDSVVVYKTTSPAAAAAPVALGGTKPTSTPGWSPVTVQMEVIAHLATIDNRIVNDYNSWLSVIGSEMFGGLLTAVDAQILSGNASTPQLHGILTDGGIASVDWDPTNEKRSEALHRGMTAVRLGIHTSATDIVIHPSDLEAVRFEKASGSGEFVNGEPIDGDIEGLWGLRVSSTTAISQGTALVLNPFVAGRLIVRQSPVLEINPWSETEWKKNELSLRNECRLGFGLVNAGAVCKVNLT